MACDELLSVAMTVYSYDPACVGVPLRVIEFEPEEDPMPAGTSPFTESLYPGVPPDAVQVVV